MTTRPRSARLVLPKRLAVAVVGITATTGCPAPRPDDGGPDTTAADSTLLDMVADLVATDSSPGDIAADSPSDQAPPPDVLVVDVVDAAADCGTGISDRPWVCLRDPRADVASPMCPPSPVCTPGECTGGCRACPAMFGVGGYVCLPGRSADVTPSCPADRVCEAGECPAGCNACRGASYCFPDGMSDASMDFCGGTARPVCDGAECPAGCRAVG